MTVDRLLVLLLSLSFLLLAPPAAAQGHAGGPQPTTVSRALVDHPAHQRTPDADEAVAVLTGTTPETPVPGGSGDDGPGSDNVILAGQVRLDDAPPAPPECRSGAGEATAHTQHRPWSTGPPAA